MSINVWYKNNTYFIRYDGKQYTRKSYVAAKELIDSFIANMVLIEQHSQRAA
jgi:hypothetical protein